MATDTQVLIAFILFLGLFGWVGMRRGGVSELIFLGVVNGIVLIALLLPRLANWLTTTTGAQATEGSVDVIVAFVTGLWNLFYQTLQSILQRIGPISPSGWLLIITVLLILIAWPMRGAASKKK